MTKNGFPKLDYSMLSSYLGRWATLIVFSAIVVIAAGALFLKEDDIAHMPITIGVFDLDSTAVHSRFDALAAYIREKGGGEISWKYMEDSEDPLGCDLYIMTSLRLSPYMRRGALDCSLLITVREGRKYSHGCVVVRAGGLPLEEREMTAAFSSPYSAANFLSPYGALAGAFEEFRAGRARYDFVGSEERVVYGVLYGAFTFGGISMERLGQLEEHGLLNEGELEQLLVGEPYPELVAAVDRSMDERKHRRFRDRFVLLTERMPAGLRADLSTLGVSGFVQPRDEDIAVIRALADRGPKRAGGRAEVVRDQ